MNIEDPFDIKLEVIDSEKNKELATAKVTITNNNDFYKVNK
ncbi:hypothetical protein [Clostridium prolinivorans]|nr:hypothetical protein [Clostridium prolinivorans]